MEKFSAFATTPPPLTSKIHAIFLTFHSLSDRSFTLEALLIYNFKNLYRKESENVKADAFRYGMKCPNFVNLQIIIKILSYSISVKDFLNNDNLITWFTVIKAQFIFYPVFFISLKQFFL